MPNPTPTTALNQAIITTTTISGSVSPSAVPPPYILATGVLTDTDAANTALTCVFHVEHSFDLLTWLVTDGGGGQWQGGIANKNGVGFQRPSSNPNFPVDGQGNPAKGIRVVIDPKGNSLNIGATVAT